MRGIAITPEQAMMQEVARRYLRDEYGFSRRSRGIASPLGFDAAQWQVFADMGWLGLPFPTAYGGSGGSVFDLALLMQVFGEGLVIEPYFSTVALAGLLLLRCGDVTQIDRLLPALVSGKIKLALAWAEPGAGHVSTSVATVATRRDGGWRLNGHKAVVLDAPSADHLIVSGRTAGTRDERHGISLFLVDRAAPGAALRSYPTIDGRRAADIFLVDVDIPDAMVLGPPDHAAGALEDVLLDATAAMLGEGVGVLEAAVATTCSYLNMREQFGRKLSSFQALRHRVADLYIAKEEVKALVLLAASVAASSPPAARIAAMAAAKAMTGRTGRWICEEAVQLHGAIGITDEYVVGHYLKRIIAIDRLFGDADQHLQAYIDLRGRFDDTERVAS
jgi:alkylation response protein AidB-like acyl-CoA dehydrogenase